MNQLLAIAGGGAIGALLRYWVSNATYTLTGSAFPYGTLLVNVTGSLVMGFAYIWLLERMLGDSALRAFLLIGLLGAFTTFSTFEWAYWGKSRVSPGGVTDYHSTLTTIQVLRSLESPFWNFKPLTRRPSFFFNSQPNLLRLTTP